MGVRVLELLSYRERALKRKVDVPEVLKWIQATAWPYLFGKAADELQQAVAVRTWRGSCYGLIELCMVQRMTICVDIKGAAASLIACPLNPCLPWYDVVLLLLMC